MHTLARAKILERDFWLPKPPSAKALVELGISSRGELTCLDNLNHHYGVRYEFVSRFSFAVPCSEAINEIATLSKSIVEVGAGTGFWSALLAQAGVDAIATDCKSGENRYGQRVSSFMPVAKMNGPAAVSQYPERDVLMVWPCYTTAWAFHVADRMPPGRLLFYIGERAGGCTGTASFHRLVNDKKKFKRLASQVGIPQFHGMHDDLFIYRKLP